MATTKKTTTPRKAKADAAPKIAAVRKPRTKAAPAADAEVKHEIHAEHPAQHTETAPVAAHLPKSDGKYFYAVGRRKTSVANVRLFFGKSTKSVVNGKDLSTYFSSKGHVEEALKPLQLTGLESQVYVYVNAKGGGIHSQAQAVAHGIAQAVAVATPDFRKVLKKNGMLTRDSRMKERKKPGLKRARRGPQWAKR